jgi:hypothetical protein
MQLMIGFAVVGVLLALFFLPVFVAKTGGGKALAFLLVLLIGWTVIGWVIALVVAASNNGSYRRELAAQQRHDQMLASLRGG